MTRSAMLLAAGLGTRMRPLTERTAKPLLPLGGRPLVDHALDRLAAAQVDRVVVNTHWQAELVEAHLTRRSGGPEIVLRPEDPLLDTGGSVKAALDAVLMVHRTFQVQSDVGMGDFAVDPWGGMRRRRDREVAPYIYAGVQLASPALFADAPSGPFSLNEVWGGAMDQGRLRAVVHDGLWFHLSSPRDLSEAEAALHARETGETR